MSINRSEKKLEILRALQDRPLYSIEICKAILNTTDTPMWLYPVLRDLEEDGDIESVSDDIAHPERGGRPRYYYHLTSQGRTKLAK